MVHKFLSMFQVETRSLLWLLGTTFAIIIAVQYFELPYGNLVSVFSTPKKGKSSFQSEDIVVSAFNSTITYADHEIPVTKDTLGDVLAPQEAREPEPSFVQNSNTTSPYASGTEEAREPEPSSDDALGTEEAREPEPSSDDALGTEEAREPEPSSDDALGTEEAREPEPSSDDALGADEAREPEPSFVQRNNITVGTALVSNASEGNSTFTSESIGRLETPFASPLPSLTPTPLSSTPNSEGDADTRTEHLFLSAGSNESSTEEDTTAIVDSSGNAGQSQIDLVSLENDSAMNNVREMKKEHNTPTSAVVSISEMNNLLLQSQASYRPTKPLWSSAVDQQLLHAKSQIDNAPLIQNDPILYAPLYRNVSMFKRSYELMEEMLKVYIYREGKRPIFHQAVLKGIYASEGWFLKLLEANKKFVTRDPRKAHLFYLPFSSRMLEEVLYVPDSHSHKNLIQYLKNYLDTITSLHPFWNRTGGADHFLVACHDWAPSETKQYMAKSIRALCNADVKEGFVFGKDVSLPETYVRSAQNLLRDLGGKPPSKRPILAFFAGSMHGYLRPILLQHWGDGKDPDLKIFGRMPRAKKGKTNVYVQHMQSSKYCICAKGYEVNSPRVVEAIFYECVPVIISDNFVPPFFEVLDWESFAVFVPEKDIPNLKSILLAIPEKRLRQMQLRVKKVQQHFLWHAKPVKYDIFHMILHSVWHNRLSQITPI